MPSLREARLRHAAYFLSLVRGRIKNYPSREADWEELDNLLHQLRWARDWLRRNDDNPAAKDLLIAYGELAWELLDITRDRLSALIVVAQDVKTRGDGKGLDEQIIKKLDDILHAQERIQSALPQLYAHGGRSVTAMNIINSNIYTGDFYVEPPGVAGRQERQLGDPEGSSDDTSAGSDNDLGAQDLT